MEIISTTLTARATANYQVGEVSIEVSNYEEQELVEIEQYIINKAVHIVNELQREVNPQTTPVKPTTTVQRTAYSNAPVNNAPRYTTNNSSYRNPNPPSNNVYGGGYESQRNKPASERQLSYIQALGYTGVMPQTFLEADELLKQLKENK